MTQDDLAENDTDSSAAPASIRAAPSVGGRRSLKVLFIGLLVAVLGLVSVLVGLRVFAGQRIPELTEARLTQAEQLWDRSGPASYDMDIEIRGARPGQVHIEVRNWTVTAMTRDGRSPPPRTWDVWTVLGMFATLERELELAQDPVHEMQAASGTQLRLRCAFDSRFGFPQRYHRMVTPGGPEVFWHVTRFEPK